MNVRTALISSALLLAVLGWACEQQGPTSPSALGTPGGGSLGAAGGVSIGPDGLPILTAKGGRGKPGGDGDVTPMVANFTDGDLSPIPSKTLINTPSDVTFGKNLLISNTFAIRPLTPTGQTGPDVTFQSAYLTARLDNKTGEIASVKVWLSDTLSIRNHNVLWHTDKMPVENKALPNPDGFTIEVDLDNVPLHAKGDKGVPASRGSISVGHLVYTPVP